MNTLILLIAFLPFPLPHPYENYKKGDYAPAVEQKESQDKGAVIQEPAHFHIRIPL